jgi:glycosyltransferase involved in cell wall biosynthesis
MVNDQISRSQLVSIIIPNYNYSQYLQEAIDSALNQTYHPVEVIVVDDGSTDHSKTVIQQCGDRIQSVFHENRGLPSARNSGIAIATGDYFLFLDADDILFPDAVSQLLNAFAEMPECGIIFGYSERVNADGQTLSLHQNEARCFVYEEFVCNNFILVPEALVKRKVLQTVGVFNPRFLQGEDYDLWIRASKRFTIRHIEQPIAKIRTHAANMSNNRVKQLTWELQVIQSHTDGSLLMRRSLAKIYHRLAYECRIVHQKMLFRKYTIEAIKYNPFYWKNYVYLVYSFFMS